MARYTCSYLVKVQLEQLPLLLDEILHSCGFEIIYQAIGYIMAREIPGKIDFSKLVSVDVFIDATQIQNNQVPLTWVVKSDELPLHHYNHCWQRFNQIQQEIGEHSQWHLVPS
ncbi:conserved hypothetical protein [Gloeothece citriformis PCC 7424]|uniref:Uncharacterized protein n=1 Tax=Gloeothece citriformis (strain PCC 7424) TaxID=65393 RepID=B7K737_GLOC7|nr:hypothetical protein [Gloeothece citriformis]ACK69605.1 conserved hypothetical protein [Gloeothece citriformis PCC 7424]